MIGMTRGDLSSNCDDKAVFFCFFKFQADPLRGKENISSDLWERKDLSDFFSLAENTHILFWVLFFFVIVRSAVAPSLTEWR